MFAAYIVLAVIGAVLPLAAFLPWLTIHGLDAPAFLAALFANPVSSFFAWDVILSASVMLLLVAVESARTRRRHYWWAVAATVLIGVSCGLPLFLALRERAPGGRA